MQKSIDLLKAIEAGFRGNQFLLKSQPIVPLRNPAHFRDYEVFIATGNGGLFTEDGSFIKVSLKEIIETLEENEKTIALDQYVITKTLNYLKTSPERQRNSRFHINLSGKSLNNELFLRKILSLFENGEIPKNRISFELTETALIESFEHVINFILKAQSYGCEFSLDDFGKGYSSFHYLVNLPVNCIKIDGYYTKRMHSSKTVRNIIKSLTYLAKELKITTVCECIEQERDYRLAKDLGVDYGQGWYFAAPSTLWNDNLSVTNSLPLVR